MSGSGSVSGIIGNPRKPFHRGEDEYLDVVRQVVKQHPTVVVLHESPAIDEVPYGGSTALRYCLESLPQVFVISGHRHWEYPALGTLKNGTEVLNAEGRAVLLRRATKN